jgi:hypothetical protein
LTSSGLRAPHGRFHINRLGQQAILVEQIRRSLLRLDDLIVNRQVFEVQVQILLEPVPGTPMCAVEKSTRLQA